MANLTPQHTTKGTLMKIVQRRRKLRVQGALFFSEFVGGVNPWTGQRVKKTLVRDK